MKRIVALLIMAVLLLGVVSAEGQVGVTVMPDWFFITSANGTSIEGSMGETRMYVGIDGSNYFGENGGWGIEYGFSALFPCNMWANDTTISTQYFNAGAAFNIGAGYRYEFNDLVGIVAGLGLRFNIDSTMSAMSEGGMGPVFLMFDMYGRVAADFTLFNHLRFNAGFLLGGPLFSVTLGQDYNISYSGIFLSPYVGISYAY